MRGKGRFLLDSEICRIVWLLTWTDLSLADIAKRMCCSTSAVNSVNRRMKVRLYAGRRTSWRFNGKRTGPACTSCPPGCGCSASAS
jgi:hypothetical protein